MATRGEDTTIATKSDTPGADLCIECSPPGAQACHLEETTIGSADSRVDVDGSSLSGLEIDVLSPLASDMMPSLGTSNHLDNGVNNVSQQGWEQNLTFDRPAVVGTEQVGSLGARADSECCDSVAAHSVNHFPSSRFVEQASANNSPPSGTGERQTLSGFRWADTATFQGVDDFLPSLATDSESDIDPIYGSDEEAEWDIDSDFDFGLDPERPPIPDPPFSWPSPFCSLPSDPLNTTPIDIHRWEELTESLPNQEAVEYVSRGLREGFSLQFHPIPLTSVRRNMPSSYRSPEVIDDYLREEISLGRVAGPFSEPPLDNFHINRFGVVPKDESDKFSLILDLESWSINELSPVLDH